MKIHSMIAVLAISTPLLGHAQAPPPAGGPPPAGASQGAMGGDKSLDQHPFFNSLDKDKDGKVTLEEWKAAGLPANVFEMIAPKGKGYASWQDFEAHPPMSGFDANKDGKVTLAEMKTAIEGQMKAGGPGGPPAGPGGPPAAAPAR